MGFHIEYGYGVLGAVAIFIGLGALAILGTFIFAAAKAAREDVLEEDRDREP